MADERVIKIAIAPLATTAYTTKQPKKRKAKTEQFLGKKRETDRARNKTRVNIGGAFRRWRELMELKEAGRSAQRTRETPEDFPPSPPCAQEVTYATGRTFKSR